MNAQEAIEITEYKIISLNDKILYFRQLLKENSYSGDKQRARELIKKAEIEKETLGIILASAKLLHEKLIFHITSPTYAEGDYKVLFNADHEILARLPVIQARAIGIEVDLE